MFRISFTPALAVLLLFGLQLSGESPVGRVQFVDVTRASGLDFSHSNGASGNYRLLEIMGSGLALLDYDQDGFLDLFLVNGSSIPDWRAGDPANKLFRNRGDGTFEDVSKGSGLLLKTYGMGTAVGDYDNDGDPDLCVTGFPRSYLFRNNGDGSFTDVSYSAGIENRGHWGSSAGFLDFNRDGLLDLFLCNYVSYQPQEESACGTGNYRNYCHPTTFEGDFSVLYQNRGNGSFADVSASSGIAETKGKALGVAFADFDGDDYPDIFVANDTVADFLFKNNRDGTFEEVAFEVGVALDENGEARAGMGTDFGDYNGDGRPDLVVTNFADEGNALFRNQGGFFTEVTFLSGIHEKSYLKVGFGTRLFDYDNDGDLDAFMANGHIDPSIQQIRDYVTFEQENLLYENQGGRRFREVSLESGDWAEVKNLSRGAAFGDLDNDGDVDIVVTNNASRVNLLRNEGGNRKNWLVLKLVGTESNRDAIGAQVRARVGDSVLHRRVETAASYLASQDPRVHLGLGDADEVSEIEIAWPSGQRQQLRRIPGNQILTIKEGISPVSPR